jgi:hypothetical protein
LIETFRKLFNPQNDGHLDLFLGGLSCTSGLLGRNDLIELFNKLYSFYKPFSFNVDVFSFYVMIEKQRLKIGEAI